jgi:phage gp36-like protein
MPYIDQTEYVRRFGAQETVRITDTAKTGQIDATKLEEAFGDWSAYADSYLAGRYVLPITPAPELLVRIVADLSREALHGTRPTETVTAAADRARALLKDLSAGRASIPAPANGDAPAMTGSDLPAASNDRRARVFTDAALADYTGIGIGYGGTVFNGPRGW